MPYPLTLQAYALPEWFVEPPAAWEQRLREVSPITERMSHLRFRFRNPSPSWNWPEQGQWELYACTPRHLVSQDRAEQFRLHWSEIPLEPEKPVPDAAQRARKVFVTSYQHYLWHVHGVEARRCWVLQGPNGGTPAVYTPREKRLLEASNVDVAPFPLGFFPACPFDERAVLAIARRDRFLQANRDLDELEKRDRPDALRRESEDAEKAFRSAFLDWWYETTRPQAEFMASFLRTSESDRVLPKGTRAMANAATQWKDHFLETGEVLHAPVASSRSVAMAVPGATPDLTI